MNLFTDLNEHMSKLFSTKKSVKIPYKIDYVEETPVKEETVIVKEEPKIEIESVVAEKTITNITPIQTIDIDDKYITIIKSIQEFKNKSGHRVVNQIAVHCSATPEGKNYTIDDIDRWHKERGFTKQKISGRYCGYHFVINLDGTIMLGRNLQEIGAHVENYNRNSIGICYIGGLSTNGKSKDTRTTQQKEALKWLISYLKKELKIVIVKGHRDYPNVKKDCPCFNAIPEYLNV